MAVSEIVLEFARVSETLHQYFPDAPRIAHETNSQYSSSHELEDVRWLDEKLPLLASVLLVARFTLILKCEVLGYRADFVVQSIDDNLILTDANTDESALSTDPIPPEAQQALYDFKNLFQKSSVEFKSLVQHAAALADKQIEVTFRLDLYLDKRALNNRLQAAAASEVTANIVSFLFAEQLINKLKEISVDEFETEFLTPERLTLFLVFDFDGGLAGHFLTICGRQQHDEAEALMSKHLSAEALLRAKQSHRFRQSTSFGNFVPKWLTPELFTLTVTRGSQEVNHELKQAFQRLQPIVAAIFMADLVEADEAGIYSIEYRGLRPRKYQLQPAVLLANDHCPGLYELYEYAYAESSADKLEIVQQFLSQFAEDAASLCTKATDVREAARKTHDRTLIVKVQEYFESRQSVQERIQTAISQLTSDIITLSRDVSSDVYKVMGIIALAIAGSFFKADIESLALLLGFLTVGIYLFIVISYHLPTLAKSDQLRRNQHVAYINSFSDVLTAEEIAGFVGDQNWAAAQNAFSDKRRWTRIIYLAFCVGSFLVAAGIAISMAVSLWRTPVIPPGRLPDIGEVGIYSSANTARVGGQPLR